jgi:hypothetical protein
VSTGGQAYPLGRPLVRWAATSACLGCERSDCPTAGAWVAVCGPKGQSPIRAGKALHEDMREGAARLEELMALHRDVAILGDAWSLSALSDRGCRCGSWHPFQPFWWVRSTAAFHGATVGIDADDERLRVQLEALARTLGATPKLVPGRRPCEPWRMAGAGTKTAPPEKISSPARRIAA